MTDELTRWSAAELAEALSRRQISSVEVTQAHLDRTAVVDSSVHSYLCVDGQGALATANAVDQRRAAGEPARVSRRSARGGQGRAHHGGPADDVR